MRPLRRRVLVLPHTAFASSTAAAAIDLQEGGNNPPVIDLPLERPPTGHAWWITAALVTEGTGDGSVYAAYLATDRPPTLQGYSGLLPSGVGVDLMIRVPRNGRIWAVDRLYDDQNVVILECSLYPDDPSSPGDCR